MRLDKENSNTHWQDAMDLELTGKAQFHNGKAVTPDGFQKIRVHFVYAVKHDGRFKARLVADGHLTKEPVESIYSGVVSLRSLRMVVFLSQLNDLEIWGADVGIEYLEAYTDEKLCTIAGPEFKELQRHLLIMIKALHGTHSGGARWHDRLFDILQELKLKPSKADPDAWMRPEPRGTCYEYIAVYVDDLAIAAKDPQAFCNELKKKYNLKLKGVGPLEYHLGCTYKKDPDGTLAADPRRIRAQPRKGHLDRPKRIVGYPLFLPDSTIRFRTGEPDFSSLKDQEYDWTISVYSGACEQIPHDIPKPLGKHVQTTHYVDATLHHDLGTGKAVTAVLHFLNLTPIDAYSKRHHLVSYHRVKEAIAAKYISFHWEDGKSNPADILSKHWEFATMWPMLKPILFWRGETATQLKGSDRIPSTTPGVEPPRDARDSGSARSHSTHLETSSSDRPKMVTYTEPQTIPSYMSVKCTRRTLRMPSFARGTNAQPSLSNFPWRDSNFGERTRSCGMTLGEQNFPTSPQNKFPNSHIVRYTRQFEQYLPHTQNERRAHPNWAPTKEPIVSCWRYTPTPKQDRFQDLLKAIFPTSCTQI